jgi:hypothetical protein
MLGSDCSLRVLLISSMTQSSPSSSASAGRRLETEGARILVEMLAVESQHGVVREKKKAAYEHLSEHNGAS